MRKNFLSPILFHYTDAETARTIIRTQEFRLSPKEKLNDNHQISAYLERAHRIAIELLGEKKVGGDFLEHMKKWVPEKYFIGCFTESPNNQWMWSNYAKNGGVCMSFYDEGFRAHHKNLDLTIHKMNYPTIEEWDAETAKYFEDISPLLGLNERFKEFREGLASVLIQCIANKNELYKEENETRVIFVDSMHGVSKLIEVRDEYAYVKLPQSCLTRVFVDTVFSVEAENFL